MQRPKRKVENINNFISPYEKGKEFARNLMLGGTGTQVDVPTAFDEDFLYGFCSAFKAKNVKGDVNKKAFMLEKIAEYNQLNLALPPVSTLPKEQAEPSVDDIVPAQSPIADPVPLSSTAAITTTLKEPTQSVDDYIKDQQSLAFRAGVKFAMDLSSKYKNKKVRYQDIPPDLIHPYFFTGFISFYMNKNENLPACDALALFFEITEDHNRALLDAPLVSPAEEERLAEEKFLEDVLVKDEPSAPSLGH